MLSDEERRRAERWERLRKIRRLSQQELANMVGIKQQSIRLILAGVNRPEPSNAEKIEAALRSVPHCTKCHRAFLDGVPDDYDSEGQAAEAEAEWKAISGVPPRAGGRRKTG